jgi:hypothetical protein
MEKVFKVRTLSPADAIQCPSCFTLNLPDHARRELAELQFTCVLCGRQYVEPPSAPELPALVEPLS